MGWSSGVSFIPEVSLLVLRCAHRQQGAALGCDEHINIAGEFHLVVVKVIVNLLPRDQVAQSCDVTHTYHTKHKHKRRSGLVSVSSVDRLQVAEFVRSWFLEASPVMSSCPCSSWVSSRKSDVFVANCRAPLTSRLAT